MTSLDGIKRLVNSDVTEGEITTRSNLMKFRLECRGLRISFFLNSLACRIVSEDINNNSQLDFIK